MAIQQCADSTRALPLVLEEFEKATPPEDAPSDDSRAMPKVPSALDDSSAMQPAANRGDPGPMPKVQSKGQRKEKEKEKEKDKNKCKPGIVNDPWMLTAISEDLAPPRPSSAAASKAASWLKIEDMDMDASDAGTVSS